MTLQWDSSHFTIHTSRFTLVAHEFWTQLFFNATFLSRCMPQNQTHSEYKHNYGIWYLYIESICCFTYERSTHVCGVRIYCLDIQYSLISFQHLSFVCSFILKYNFFYHNNTVSHMITNLLGNASIEIKKNLMVDRIFSLMSLLVYLNLCVFSMWLVTHMKVKIANN